MKSEKDIQFRSGFQKQRPHGDLSHGAFVLELYSLAGNAQQEAERENKDTWRERKREREKKVGRKDNRGSIQERSFVLADAD